jgi:serralysin
VSGFTNSVINGGNGNDTINWSTAQSTRIDAGFGNDLLRGSITQGSVLPTNINLGSGDDIISVSFVQATTVIDASFGNDLLLLGSIANSTIFGGDGNDILRENNLIRSSTINMEGSDDFITAFTIDGGSQVDLGDLNDSLTVQVLSGSTIFGGSATDTIRASQSTASVVDGGSGSDTIGVFGNFNTINGGLDSDTINFGGDANTVNAGAGFDVLTGSSGRGSVVNLNEDPDNITYFGAIDNAINGGFDNDRLRADRIFNRLDGGTGDDLFDTLSNPLTANVLTGGNGSDDFLLPIRGSNEGAIIIRDFQDGVDKIAVPNLITGSLTGGQWFNTNINNGRLRVLRVENFTPGDVDTGLSAGSRGARLSFDGVVVASFSGISENLITANDFVVRTSFL